MYSFALTSTIIRGRHMTDAHSNKPAKKKRTVAGRAEHIPVPALVNRLHY